MDLVLSREGDAVWLEILSAVFCPGANDATRLFCYTKTLNRNWHATRHKIVTVLKRMSEQHAKLKRVCISMTKIATNAAVADEQGHTLASLIATVPEQVVDSLHAHVAASKWRARLEEVKQITAIKDTFVNATTNAMRRGEPCYTLVSTTMFSKILDEHKLHEKRFVFAGNQFHIDKTSVLWQLDSCQGRAIVVPLSIVCNRGDPSMCSLMRCFHCGRQHCDETEAKWCVCENCCDACFCCEDHREAYCGQTQQAQCQEGRSKGMEVAAALKRGTEGRDLCVIRYDGGWALPLSLTEFFRGTEFTSDIWLSLTDSMAITISNHPHLCIELFKNVTRDEFDSWALQHVATTPPIDHVAPKGPAAKRREKAARRRARAEKAAEQDVDVEEMGTAAVSPIEQIGDNTIAGREVTANTVVVGSCASNDIDECPICLRDAGDGVRLDRAFTPCGHVFCSACGDAQRGSSCPVCNAAVETVLKLFRC